MPRIVPSKAPRTVLHSRRDAEAVCYHERSGVGEEPMVDTREPLDSLIAPPSRFTAGTTFPRAKEIRLYDTTLRDGEQTPGRGLHPRAEVRARGDALRRRACTSSTWGFPSAAPSERRALELILEGKKKGRIRARSRDHRDVPLERARHRRHHRHPGEDGGAAATTARSSSSPRAPTSTSSTRSARPCSQLEGRKPEEWLDLPVSFYREANVRMACAAAIAHARSRGVREIEFGGEDGSRADVDYLIELGRGLLRGGRDALLVPRHRRLLRSRGRRLLHPEAGGRVPGQAAGRPLPQRLRPRRLQHRARAPPRRHHPHLHRERPRRAGGQRAAPHHGDDPEGALRRSRSRASATTCSGRCAARWRSAAACRWAPPSPSSATTSSATRPASTPPGSRSIPRSTR